MKWLFLHTVPGAGWLLGLIIVATLSLDMAAPAQAAIKASFTQNGIRCIDGGKTVAM